MLNIEEITDHSDSRLNNYLSLKKNKQDNISTFIADGSQVVIKALKSDFHIKSILCTKEFIEKNNDLNFSKSEDIFIASKEILSKIVGHKIHQGVMAEIYTPVEKSIDQLKGNVVILDGLTQSENVGSILRNAIGLGLNNVLVSNETCPPFIRRAVRVSMGTIFNANIFNSSDLLFDIKKLSNSGYQIISLDTHQKSKDIKNFKFPKKFALILGNEIRGVSKKLIDISDEIIQIPMHNQLASLNVASSCAIALYHTTI